MNTKNSLKNIIKKLNNKTEKYKNASIVIFGTASCGNMAYNCIKSKEKKISAFIDNNEANNNKIIIDNIKCFTPETYISDTQENHIYVIATGNHLYKLLKEQTEKSVLPCSYRLSDATPDPYNDPENEHAHHAAYKQSPCLYLHFPCF